MTSMILPAKGSGNSRNGTTPRTVITEVGDVQLAQPRDRNASFTSVLVPKGQRRLGGAEDMIISLYAGGMTIRDIQHHLAATLGTESSHETISKLHRGRCCRGGHLLAGPPLWNRSIRWSTSTHSW